MVLILKYSKPAKHLMILCWLCSYNLCHAQTELKNLLQHSEKMHPIWMARQHEVDARQAQLGVIKNTRLPHIEASYQANVATFNNLTGMFYGSGLLPISGPPSEENIFTPTTGSAVGLLATWSPFTFGQLDAKLKVASQEVLMHQTETQDRLLKFQTQIIQQYLDIVKYQSLLAINMQNKDRLVKTHVLVHDLIKNGLTPSADSAFVRAEMIRNHIERSNYEGQILRGKIKLAELIGKNVDEISDILWLQQLPVTSTLTVNTSHPTEQVATQFSELENARLTAIEKNYLPKLTFFGSTFARGTGVEQTFFTGLGLQRVNYGVGAHLAVPLFKGTEKTSLINQQQSKVKAAEEQINITKLSLKQQEDMAQSLLDEATQVASQMPMLLSEINKVFEATNERYQRGLVTLNEVLLSQYHLQKVASESQMAVLNVWQALLVKAYAKGDVKIFLDHKN
jgi:outer membrane protein